MNGWRKVEKFLLERLAADSRLTRADIRVMLAALRYEIEPGLPVMLSARFAAGAIDLSKRSAENALANLQKFGYLKKTGRDPKTGTGLYLILACSTEAEPDTEAGADTEAQPDTLPKQERTPAPKHSRTNRRLQKTAKKTTSEKREKSAAEILSAYPKTDDQTRSRAKKHLTKLLAKHKPADLLAAVNNYRRECEVDKIEDQFIRGVGNFFGRSEDFVGYLPANYEPPKSDIDKIQHTAAEAAEYWQLEDELAASGQGGYTQAAKEAQK